MKDVLRQLPARSLLLGPIGGTVLLIIAGPGDELARDGSTAPVALRIAATYVLLSVAAWSAASAFRGPRR